MTPNRAGPSNTGLSAAQAYQASTGYNGATPQASQAFNQRVELQLPQPMPSQPSFPSAPTGYESPGSSIHSKSRSPPLRQRTTDTTERLMSPPPDYVNALANLGFNGSGSGPLDSVPGIPRRGEVTDFGKLEDRWQDADETAGTIISTSPCTTQINVSGSTIGTSQAARPHGRRHHSSSSTSSGGHRRMASDSSLASSGYTLTSISQRPQMALVFNLFPTLL